jgi:hypothetical protein
VYVVILIKLLWMEGGGEGHGWCRWDLAVHARSKFARTVLQPTGKPHWQNAPSSLFRNKCHHC